MAKSKKQEQAQDGATPPEGAGGAQPTPATYIAQWHIKRDGKMVEPGEAVELTAAEAQQLGAAVKPA